MAQTTAVLIYDLNPPPTLLSVPPALRARPHTGALNHKLLLLFAGCLQPQSTGLKVAPPPLDEGAAKSSEPPQGAAAQPRGNRYGRGVGFDEQPKAQQFKAKKAPSTLTGEGAVFSLEPPLGAAELSAACGRSSEAKLAQRSNFHKGAPPPAEKIG